MMKKKIYRLHTILLFTGLLLHGCGKNPAAAESTKVAEPLEKLESEQTELGLRTEPEIFRTGIDKYYGIYHYEEHGKTWSMAISTDLRYKNTK